MKVSVIGGGASGFFTAIRLKEYNPSIEVSIYEKSKKVLSKVKISGGGRCNVTNALQEIKVLSKGYPRGEKVLKKLLGKFSNKDMISWLEENGVELTWEDDLHVFPKTQNSQTIINLFLSKCREYNISIYKQKKFDAFDRKEPYNEVFFSDGEMVQSDAVVFAIGGTPNENMLKPFLDKEVETVSPLPSLFTFNMPSESVVDLMGIVQQNVTTKIVGTKLTAKGPLLFTHWGMSGPAIILLSSIAARKLAETNYEFKVTLNWIDLFNQDEVKHKLSIVQQENRLKIMKNVYPFGLKSRLWLYLLAKCKIESDKKWGELSKKEINLLIEILTNDVYQVSGKTTFKEEFVTAGGISLNAVNTKTLESKRYPSIYFTGELLNIDGITGGYNFQAAWTTADTVARIISKKYHDFF